MVINFNGGGGITRAEVQEMINDAVDFTTGILNLSYATSGQVREALTEPDRWMFSIDYSGETYVEKYRQSIRSGESYDVYFYVQGAPSGYRFSRICDGRMVVNLDSITGEISIGRIGYAPDIIYNLDRMTAEQLIFLEGRLRNYYSYPDNARFSAFWTYNNRRYTYSAGINANTTTFNIVGTCMAFENSISKIYYDYLYIDPNGTITHNEYVSDTTLTPVQ